MKGKKKIIWLAIGVLLIIIFANSNSKSKVILGEYKGIKAEKTKVTVTDKQINDQVNTNIMDNIKPSVIKDRAVIKGDIANIDFVGKVNGVAFEGGAAEKHDLTIGSGNFIPGFEDQIIGMKTGQTKDLKVTFPDPYQNNPELAGVEAVFTTKLNSISAKKKPDKITDDLIKKTFKEYSTLKEYRASVRKELETKAKEEIEKTVANEVWAEILANAKFETISGKKTKYYEKLFVENHTAYAELYNVSLQEFIEKYLGMNQTEFNQEKEKYAKETVKTFALSEAIAEKENITVSKEEFDNYMKDTSFNDERKKLFAENVQDELLYKKVLEFVVSKAEIIEVDKKD